ncbi:hypothetical protein L596_024524 [Steinernema carpocapsae]|uniref:LisH domain-containing protein n=1 Tax=Steinernema carpocapsae TaxID=34508 RepID=A0A4U5MGY9_STECR|nr:hypothetical protein L596_024524 [Steinernema carpocapsae]
MENRDNFYAPLRTTSAPLPRQRDAATDETCLQFGLIYEEWLDQNQTAGYLPTEHLKRMSELFESAYQTFLLEDPDPNDDRIPVRTNPATSYSLGIKELCSKDQFLSQLCMSYVFSTNNDVATQATRLLLSILPVIDTHSIVMDVEDFCEKLYKIAEEGPTRELRAYAIGLIAACTDITKDAAFSAYNTRLISLSLERLKEVQQAMKQEYLEEDQAKMASMPTSFAQLREEQKKASETMKPPKDTPKRLNSTSRRNPDGSPLVGPPRKKLKAAAGALNATDEPEKTPKNRKKSLKALETPLEAMDNGWSNSSITQLNKITYKPQILWPLSYVIEQRMIFQYLVTLGEFQDLLSAVIENNTLDLLLKYLDLNNTRDVRLTYDAIRFISSLLVHRKFAFAWIAKRGVEKLMRVVRESMASIGVATCLYYLSYSNDVMEAVCSLPESTLDEIVDYALYLLAHSYESGRATIAMFFSYALPYRPVLERFDKKDGRRTLLNYVSTLTLMHDGPEYLFSDDVESSIQCMSNAFATLRSYAEAHLHLKLIQLVRKSPQLEIPSIVRNLPPTKSLKLEPNALRQAVQAMNKLFSYNIGWKAIVDLERLGFMKIVNKVMLLVRPTECHGRLDIMRSLLEFVWVVTTFPAMRMRLLDENAVDGEKMKTIFGYIMEICDRRIFDDSDECMRLSLFIVSNLVGAPLNQYDPETRKGTPSADVVKMWERFRSHNGLLMLMHLISNDEKNSDRDPVNDVLIREAACNALIGLARCEDIRQMLSKLPLVGGDELLATCKKIYQAPYRPEQELFYKQAKTLVEKVMKLTIKDEDAKDFSQERIIRSNIIAKTRYDFRADELQFNPNAGSKQPTSSLNDVLKVYFKEKHSHCKNPTTICPPFSLYTEHKCAAIHRSRPQLNFMARYLERGMRPIYRSSPLYTADLYHIYSRFAPHKTFHNKDGAFMSCAFSADDEHILLGTFEGELLWYNISTEDVECRQQCHTGGPLNEIISSSDGSLLLTSTNTGSSSSILWKLGEVPKLASRYSSASHARFSNTSNQYAVTTSDDYAKVYDLESESVVVQFKEGSTTAGHPYQRNIAMFDFKDTMLMSNGVLYDFRVGSAAPIHTFDKLNTENSGIFHPDCISLILNTEVYDLRNYRLMHHVPILDDAKIAFNSMGTVLYSMPRTDPDEEDDFNTVFKPQVTTLNAKNFEIIATNPFKRYLYDFSVDHSEGRIATVEKCDGMFVPEGNMCRILDIGKVRDDDEARAPHDDEHDNSDDEDLFNDSDRSDGSDDDDDDDEIHDLLFPPTDSEAGSGDEDSDDEDEEEDDSDSDGSHNESFGSLDAEIAEMLQDEFGGEEIYDDADGEDGMDDDEEDLSNDGEDGASDEEDEDEDLPGTSTIVLNPRLRRERRAQERRQEEQQRAEQEKQKAEESEE